MDYTYPEGPAKVCPVPLGRKIVVKESIMQFFQKMLDKSKEPVVLFTPTPPPPCGFKLKSVFFLFLVLGAGLAFTACDNAASVSASDTSFKVVDANNQFVGFLMDGGSHSFTVYRPQLNGSNYYPAGIFTLTYDGVLDGLGIELSFTEDDGKGDPYVSDPVYWQTEYPLFGNYYNTDTDKVDEDKETLYTWADTDADGFPRDKKNLQIKSRVFFGSKTVSNITPVYEDVYKVKIITQKDVLGGLDIKGPVKIGG
jgi:hypothetical protein